MDEKRRKRNSKNAGGLGYIDESGRGGCLKINQSCAKPRWGGQEHEIRALAPSQLRENQKRGKQHFERGHCLQSAASYACCRAEMWPVRGTSIAKSGRDKNINPKISTLHQSIESCNMRKYPEATMKLQDVLAQSLNLHSRECALTAYPFHRFASLASWQAASV